MLLLGLDLVKDVGRLNAAYYDADGVTEAFVRNALTAVNRGLDATFEQRRFVFEPEWDPKDEWMDIGFRALEAHTVSVRRLELELAFESEERLRAEVSSKFRRQRLELGARPCRPSHRVVVDRCRGRFRNRGRAAGLTATRGEACPRTASAATSTRSR